MQSPRTRPRERLSAKSATERNIGPGGLTSRYVTEQDLLSPKAVHSFDRSEGDAKKVRWPGAKANP
jgi:hypothetical protein